MQTEKKFTMTIPATLEKTENGEWRIYGLSSNSAIDREQEKINMKGLDLTPIKKGKGTWSWDHGKGPENTIGIIDTFKKTDDELHLGGYLFKNHDRAKSVHQIMSSLGKSDRGRVGMSVEGVIKQRDGKDGKEIKKAVITGCALTMNPVNADTYASLVKSFSEVEFERDSLGADFLPDVKKEDSLTFTSDQVVSLLEKALSVGDANATQIPSDRSGGDALAREDLDKDLKSVTFSCKSCNSEPCKCKKSLKKGDSKFFKSQILEALTALQELYPNISRSTLWELFKDRLNFQFEIQDSNQKESLK